MRVHKWVRCVVLFVGALTMLTACGGGSFDLGLTPQDVELTQGQTVELEIELNRVGGFTGSVDLSIENTPQGVEGTLEPDSTANRTSLLTFSAADDAPAGTYAVTVRAKSGRLEQEEEVTLRVVPRPDFQLIASPATLVLKQGDRTSVTVRVERQGGFTGEVLLELAEVAEDLEAELETEDGDEALLYIHTERDTPAGDYRIVVLGRSEDRDRSTQLVVAVEAVPGFDLSAEPASVSLARQETQPIAVRIQRWADFTSTVHLEIVEELPAGVEATFEPNPVEEGGSTLTLRASEDARLGTYSFTVRGTADDLAEELPIDMVVVGRHGDL